MNLKDINNIKLSDFNYTLPLDRIAQSPLDKRDESKLLYYKNGSIAHKNFKNIATLIPAHSQLILNNAKVIPARINFYKVSGAKIEIFFLEPILPHPQIELALQLTNKCTWKAMIGNLKRWKNDEVLALTININHSEIEVLARLSDKSQQMIELSWTQNIPQSQILEAIGKTPLPPYIKREVNDNDTETYQTVFAKKEGAVAAPTAGLHFSKSLLNELKEKLIKMDEVTLYVGAGTFAPVNVERMKDHDMHTEMISVSISALGSLVNDNYRIAVGTTSLRTLESLYWIGVKLHYQLANPFIIEKLFPYNFDKVCLSWEQSIDEIINHMKLYEISDLLAETAIMIMPGYQFKSAKGLITNFHYPNTTLIMLVAAFIGNDWKSLYQEALSNNYRFLSYGDSSLLLPSQL